jgi:hypothetical protein
MGRLEAATHGDKALPPLRPPEDTPPFVYGRLVFRWHVFPPTPGLPSVEHGRREDRCSLDLSCRADICRPISELLGRGSWVVSREWGSEEGRAGARAVVKSQDIYKMFVTYGYLYC